MGLFDKLTERQEDVYKFIREKIRGRGYGPTVREIAARFRHPIAQRRGLPSEGPGEKGTHHPRAEHVAGDPTCGRADSKSAACRWPARIAAGVLHEAIEQNERVDFQDMFDPSRKTSSCLQVKGDSMIEDQIADGDYVVVQKQRTARKGQIVVALTDEGEATLKRWFPEKNRIRLEPANSAMKPIYVKDARVLGVVVGVVRKVG